MINVNDILETIRMIQDENLDIRTITMGISLLDCIDADIDKACTKVYDKITRCAERLVKTGEDIEREYGIPIINKRISVTPIAMLLGAYCYCQCRMQKKPGQICPNHGQSSADCRRQPYWRLFRFGTKGIFGRGFKFNPFHSGGPFCYIARLFLRQRRLY